MSGPAMKRNRLFDAPKLYVLGWMAVCTAVSLWLVHRVGLPTGAKPYLFIGWDVFLAWVPVMLIVLLEGAAHLKSKIVKFALVFVLGAVWFCFYPNSPYLVTELLHVFIWYEYDPKQKMFWYDPMFWNHVYAMLSIAILGLMLSAFSLLEAQRLIRRRFGWAAGWTFVLGMLALSSFGVYIGRFVRWNSWDVAIRPVLVLRQMLSMPGDPVHVMRLVPFCGALFLLLLMSYGIVYGFMRLRK